MDERLIVRNFLCLKDIDIEVKDFLVLIGPQAAGKSLCAKLLYFFGAIYGEIVRYQMIAALDKQSDVETMLRDRFETFFPKHYWAEQEFYIEYYRGTEKKFGIYKKKEKQKLELYLSPKSLEVSTKTMQSLLEFAKSNDNPEKSREFLQMLSDEHFLYRPVKDMFIPAGRSFFSLLQKNIFRFLQTSNNIDPFLVAFGILYEDIKQTGYEIPAEAQELIHSILKGDYVYGENMLLTGNGKVALELLSSGQQEALPLALVFAYIVSLRLKPSEYAYIYVEEPEAHLFPDAQEQISRLISFLRHNAAHKLTFVVTTHSPYILAAFNNLIKAGNMVKQNPGLKDAVCKEIPESMHIDIERFSAYSLENGRAVSIIDKETNLINADAIDSVSESIMEIFNTLQDIEFDGSKAGEYV
jgi:ABC-type cobalamin/Fe3+-siderophores transport system ATPase subunit